MNLTNPPAKYKSYASIGMHDKFATAAAMRPGEGFTVKPSGSFVHLDIRDTHGKRIVVSIDVDGIPALIASLQDAASEVDR